MGEEREREEKGEDIGGTGIELEGMFGGIGY